MAMYLIRQHNSYLSRSYKVHPGYLLGTYKVDLILKGYMKGTFYLQCINLKLAGYREGTHLILTGYILFTYKIQTSYLVYI